MLPDAKNSDRLLAKEKSLLILDLKLMMLPLSMNSVILEHVCLPSTIITGKYLQLHLNTK